MSVTSTTYLPRLLLIDHTQIGDGTATGEIKANLFGAWPQNRIAQIFQVSAGRLGFSQGDQLSQFVVRARERPPSSLVKSVIEFDPEVILYRPVPDTDGLHGIAIDLIERLDTPLISWIMDDWPTFARLEEKANHADLEDDWRWILARSSLNLSISEAMSAEFGARYGADFVPVANAVDPADWPLLAKSAGPFKVRYTGSLASTMVLDSVIRVAEAVERLGCEGHDIRFEISTRKYWHDRCAGKFSEFAKTDVLVGNLTTCEYRQWLSSADVNVIAYNFDDLSRAYIRFSLANKLPECMMSGAALLAHGPPDVATIGYLDELDCGIRVKQPSEDELADALKTLMTDREFGSAIATRAREIAIANHGLSEERQRLAGLISSATRKPIPAVQPSPMALRRLMQAEVRPEPLWKSDISAWLRDRSTRRGIRYMALILSVGALIIGATGALQMALLLILVAAGMLSLPRIARVVGTARRQNA